MGGEVRVGGQELGGEARTRLIVSARYISGIGQGEELANAVTFGVRLRLDIGGKVSPGKEAVIARDAGLGVVQVQVAGGEGECAGDAGERLGVAGTVKAKEILRLLLEMIEIGPGRQ
jgi:hypothetical protein